MSVTHYWASPLNDVIVRDAFAAFAERMSALWLAFPVAPDRNLVGQAVFE
jgi:hypothetical protein